MSRTRSLKVMNYALSGPEGAASCVRFVENLGLKTLFSALMRKGSKKLKKSYKRFSESEEEGLLDFCQTDARSRVVCVR